MTPQPIETFFLSRGTRVLTDNTHIFKASSNSAAKDVLVCLYLLLSILPSKPKLRDKRIRLILSVQPKTLPLYHA